MNKCFKGVYAALPTPFFNDESLDEASLTNLVVNAENQGLDGLYVGGSTGEAFVMSLDERIRTMQIIAKNNPTDLTLIAHVGTIRTADSCQLAAVANQAGYDAVSAVTPFYYPFGFKALLEHYKAIIDAAKGLPMIVYNFPAMSGVSLSDSEIDQLLALDNVVGLKQTSGDMYQMEKISSRHDDKVVFNGFDEVFLAGQMAGAKGGIGSTYNVIGDKYVAISQAIAHGDIVKAQQIQQSANRIIDILIKTGVIQGLKYLLMKKGILNDATVRRPFASLTNESKTLLDNLLANELKHP